jgi:hypothetical protein
MARVSFAFIYCCYLLSSILTISGNIQLTYTHLYARNLTAKAENRQCSAKFPSRRRGVSNTQHHTGVRQRMMVVRVVWCCACVAVRGYASGRGACVAHIGTPCRTS